MCNAEFPAPMDAEQHCEEAVTHGYCIVGGKMMAHNIPWNKAKRGRWIMKNEPRFFEVRLVQSFESKGILRNPIGPPVSFAPKPCRVLGRSVDSVKQHILATMRTRVKYFRLNSCVHRSQQRPHETRSTRAMKTDQESAPST